MPCDPKSCDAFCCSILPNATLMPDATAVANSAALYALMEYDFTYSNGRTYAFKRQRCPALAQDRACSVYPYRPPSCRHFPADDTQFYQLARLHGCTCTPGEFEEDPE